MLLSSTSTSISYALCLPRQQQACIFESLIHRFRSRGPLLYTHPYTQSVCFPTQATLLIVQRNHLQLSPLHSRPVNLTFDQYTMINPLSILTFGALISNTLALPQRETGLYPVTNLHKRQEDTGLFLETWKELGCHGKPTAKHELLVNTNIVLDQNILAYKVSRPMGSTEQLDFSQADPNSLTPPSNTPDYYCAKFVEKTNPMRTQEFGSSLLQKEHCYQLTGGVSARVSHLACLLCGLKLIFLVRQFTYTNLSFRKARCLRDKAIYISLAWSWIEELKGTYLQSSTEFKGGKDIPIKQV